MANLPDLILPKYRHFGLSIERLAVRAVEITDKKIPVRMIESEIPQDTFRDGVLMKPSAFIAIIRKLYQAGKFTTPYAAVCFPEVFAYTRATTLPLIPLDEIQEAISWKAKDLFPFPTEDIYFDWKLLKKTESEYQLNVVAVQRKVLDPLMEALTQAGLKPLRFEPDASALTRLVKIKPEEHALLIEINQSGAYMTLMEGEKALFTTSIPISASDTPSQYVANIDKTLIEISTYYKNKSILKDGSTRIILTGILASNQWVDHCRKLLPYPAEILETAIGKPAFYKAYAAAVEEIAPPLDEQSINLLPTRSQVAFEKQQTILFYKTVLIRTLMLIMLLAVGIGTAYGLVVIKRQQLEIQVKTVRRTVETKNVDLQRLLQINAQAKNVMMLSTLRKTPAAKLEALGSLLTDAIQVTQWEFTDGNLQITIRGTAKTRTDLLSLKDRLEKSKDFTGVALPLGSLELPVNVPFNLSFKIKP